MEIKHPILYCFDHHHLMFDSIHITKHDVETRKLWVRVECVNISERAITDREMYTELHVSLQFSDSAIFYQDEPGVYGMDSLYDLSPDEDELHAFLTPLIQHTQFQEDLKLIHQHVDSSDQPVLQRMLNLCQLEHLPLTPTDAYKTELNKRRLGTLFKKPTKR